MSRTNPLNCPACPHYQPLRPVLGLFYHQEKEKFFLALKNQQGQQVLICCRKHAPRVAKPFNREDYQKPPFGFVNLCFIPALENFFSKASLVKFICIGFGGINSFAQSFIAQTGLFSTKDFSLEFYKSNSASCRYTPKNKLHYRFMGASQ